MNKEKLFEFLSDSPISHIAADNIVNILSAYGFKQVEDSDIESLCEGNYFIRRSGAVVAFKKNGASNGFMICATHTDSPAFRVKGENIVGSYGKLDTEKYGGMILSTWLDRPLGMAGRVGIRTDSGVKFKNLILDESVVIPNVAIHLNRSVNDGYKFNPAVDMLPLCSIGASRGELMQRVAEKLSVSVDDIVSHEIYLYAKDTPVSVGFSGELVLSPRLDDLACVHASLMAFLLCENKSSIPVFAAFDNEEIGSNTVQGADSLFFTDILRALSG